MHARRESSAQLFFLTGRLRMCVRLNLHGCRPVPQSPEAKECLHVSGFAGRQRQCRIFVKRFFNPTAKIVDNCARARARAQLFRRGPQTASSRRNTGNKKTRVSNWMRAEAIPPMRRQAREPGNSKGAAIPGAQVFGSSPLARPTDPIGTHSCSRQCAPRCTSLLSGLAGIEHTARALLASNP